MPNSRSGAGTPSSAKNTALSSSSKCWPVWISTSSCTRRSGIDSAAALMNCGRLPTTVRIFIAGPLGTRRRSSTCVELGLDPRPDPLGDLRGHRRIPVVAVVVDGDHGLHLAHGRGKEHLVG